MKISAIVLTKNEEENIEECLKSLQWCDEVVLIDDDSTDKTVEIAQKPGVNIFVHSLDNDFSQQRNFGLSKVKSEWVLFVDADERVSEALASEISNIPSARAQGEGKYQISNIFNGSNIKRRDFMWGKELRHGEVGNIKLLRLAKKTAGKWEGKVHEKWIIKGQTGELKNPLLHYPHQSISEFLEKINCYTNIRAKELHNQGIPVYWGSIIFYPLGKFIINYFFKLGFLDGIHGLVLAIMMSFHSFLVRGKLWLLWQKK